MTTVWTTAALALALGLAPSAHGQLDFDHTWLVDAAVVGGDDDGSSWANAYRHLQNALERAQVTPGTDEIWVAAGTYYPDRNSASPNGTGSRNASFLLQFDVSIYGGFLGLNHPQHENGETELTQRDPENNITTLSGDVADPCGDPGAGSCGESNGSPGCDNADCCHTVCIGDPYCCDVDWDQSCASLANIGVCDHCGTAEAGDCFEANGNPGCEDTQCCAIVCGQPGLAFCCASDWIQACAAAAAQLCPRAVPWAWGARHVVTAEDVDDSAVLNGFTITGGHGDGEDVDGAGILIIDANPVITRCRLTGNSADEGGGVHVTGAAQPVLFNCSFIANDAREGGGMHLETGAAGTTLANCLFNANTAIHHGGALDAGGPNAEVRVVDCTFAGNSAPAEGGGGIWVEQGTVTIINSILWDNTPNQIQRIGGSATVSFSDVQGGLPPDSNVIDGGGNIDADPTFCDAPEGNFRLLDGSPCIDTGSDTDVPFDAGDVDDDGVVAEPLPWDADTDKAASHHGRFFDVFSGPATGTGVDMGAYENQHIAVCPWDIASEMAGPPPDGEVGVNDFLRLNGDWIAYPDCPGCGADFNCDLIVNIEDFLALLGRWGLCPVPESSPSSFGGGSVGAALWLIGFTDLAAYEIWILEATDAEAQVSVQVLAELLLALD
jgi:predicted outer membrane repeat protein